MDRKDDWRQLIYLAKQLIDEKFSECDDMNEAREYARNVLSELVYGEITSLYSTGKIPWGLRPPKEQDDEDDEVEFNLRTKRKYVVHLLFPSVSYVGESLPNIDTFRFYIAHWYWYVESPVHPPEHLVKFFSSSLVYCIMDGKKPYSDLKSMLRSKWPGAEGDKEIHNNLIHMDCKGNLYRGKSEVKNEGRSKNLPSKRLRSQFCSRLYKLIMAERTLRDNLLIQILDNKEENTCLGGAYLLPPLHMGWITCKGKFYHFGYFSDSDVLCFKNYGNDIQLWSEDQGTLNWELPFTAVEPEISIPLFAYNIFSIIKPFIPKYPI